MGILIDIVLIAIILLSAFLGYKKGLVKLGTKLFAGIIAIIVTIIIYKPVSGIIINKTQIDEQIRDTIIQNTIIQNTSKAIDDKNMSNAITNQIENEMLPNEAENISKGVVSAITAIILFVVVKVVLSIAISLLDFVAKLPILKQFNEMGGIIYGLLRGILIVCICVLIMGAFTKINPENDLNNKIENSNITKFIYKNIVKF